MRAILSLLTIMAFVFSSCNDEPYDYSSFYTSPKSSKSTEATAVNESANSENEDCINDEKVSSEPIDDWINDGGYNYSNTESDVDYGGAVGPGTGSSYASNYYGAKKLKTEKTMCTVQGEKEVTPDVEHNNNNFYSEPESREDEWSEEGSKWSDDEELDNETSSDMEDDYETIEW